MLSLLFIATALPLACNAGLMGGKTDVTATMQKDDAAVVFAFNAIQSKFSMDNKMTAPTFTIVKATSQVVSGMLYDLTIRVNVDGADQLCTISIWSQPWTSTPNKISKEAQCKADDTMVASKRQLGGGMPGGVSTADNSDTQVLNALNAATMKINEQMNSLYLHKVADNSFTVTQQVVAGMKYHFEGVKLAQTSCVKNAGSDLAGCQFSANGMSQTCSFDVIWQSWMTPEYTLMNLSCN